MHVLAETARRIAAMQLPGNDFEILNAPHDFEQPEDIAEYFSLTALANTKLGRQSPSQDEITAPMVLKRLCYPFVVCEATVTTDFQIDWDQGGLVIFAGGHPLQQAPSIRSLRTPHTAVPPISSRRPLKWARIALELAAGEVNISTLVANPNCDIDWASTPIAPCSRPGLISNPSIRLKLERVGHDLWVWYKVQDIYYSPSHTPTPESVSRQWRKCRQIVNFFDITSVKGGVWVGCYASRPVQPELVHTHSEENGLFVEFEDLTIL